MGCLLLIEKNKKWVIGMNRKKLKMMVSTGVILIFIGITIMLNDFIVERREKVFSQMNLELTELLSEDVGADVDDIAQEETSPEEAQEEVSQEEPVVNYETYAGILEIPKIGFNRGFYKKESSLNNVKFNLKILPRSNYPDEDKGNVIIIGHSGNYSNSYFGSLYKLEKEDTASITYNGKKYTYKIVNIYTDKKDGTVTIYRDETKNCLTLITCTKDDETTQTIYILELVGVE